MTKTVKKLIEEIKKTPNENEYYSEKDKEIFDLKEQIYNQNWKIRELNIELGTNQQYIEYLEKHQLYKEDFEKRFIDVGYFPRPLRYVLKDNSKYDKLPSKDVK